MGSDNEKFANELMQLIKKMCGYQPRTQSLFEPSIKQCINRKYDKIAFQSYDYEIPQYFELQQIREGYRYNYYLEFNKSGLSNTHQKTLIQCRIKQQKSTEIKQTNKVLKFLLLFLEIVRIFCYIRCYKMLRLIIQKLV
ncbi:hypothetical protein FGO68_gene10108 [Halteria grandinella]|uniref:Uncharacterized protein n=1 Tax=Halteria grandinella TaxID=5974 RepID=A0A8J8NGS4_HALGN|nr:hypothetical protein FGO68_gene10108 [Halteria grandinella]